MRRNEGLAAVEDKDRYSRTLPVVGFNKVFPYESTPQNGRKIVGMN